MTRKRKEFTDNQKSEIFARDRATCAFSGISLYFLDTGIRSNWQVDWVDHILPSASGGKTGLENGICASNFFNAKKRNNTADNIYFVKNGCITKKYINVFGVPPEKLVEQLNRLKNLKPEDWFFNRCLSSVFVGFDCRLDEEFKGIEYKRKDTYWFKSAWKRLQTYQKKKSSQSIYERGLIKKIAPFGSMELLKVENIINEEDFTIWLENIYPSYRESYKAINSYFKLEKTKQRFLLICELEKTPILNPEVLSALKLHNTIT